MKNFGTLALVLALTACGQADLEEPRVAAVRPVKLVTVGAASAQQSRRFPAVIDAARSSDLSFQVGGLVEEVLVIESQSVEEGDIIARLDQRDFTSQLASARAQFQNADEEYQRAVRLAEEDAIAQNVLEQRGSQRDVAQAQLDSAEKALSDTVLRAPFSGIVASLPASRLENIQPGQSVATVISVDGLEATFDVPAAMIASVPTTTETGAYVVLDAAPNVPIDAVFKDANLVADAVSQTYAITFSFEAPENLIILPGMNAIVEVTYSLDDAGPGRVSVPLAAVASDGSGQYVWVVDAETMTVSRRDITVEEGIGETVAVTDGLTVGETIAGAGATYLADGMQVRAWTE